MSKKNRNNREKKWVPIDPATLKSLSENNSKCYRPKPEMLSTQRRKENDIVENLKHILPEIDHKYLRILSNFDSESLNCIITELSGKSPREMTNSIKELCGENPTNESSIVAGTECWELREEYEVVEDKEEEEEEELEEEDRESTNSESDAQLLDLEKEENASGNFLVLGRRFLQMAHSKFGEEMGLEDLLIDEVPLEITEQGWCPEKELMKSIYCGFMEWLGVLYRPDKDSYSGGNSKKKQQHAEDDDKMSLREVIELEQAFDDSLAMGKANIRKDKTLQLSLEGLLGRYPQIERNEMEKIFVRCDLDVCRTLRDLSKSGFVDNSCSKQVVQEPQKKKMPEKKTKIHRLEKLEEKLIYLEGRRKHVIEQMTAHNEHGGIRAYWKDELSMVKTQIEWYRTQVGLASVHEASLVTGLLLLDLHGLTSRVAMEALKQRLREVRGRGKGVLKVICGRGLHSPGGRSRLKPVVRRFLEAEGVRYQHKMDGVFSINISHLSAG